jgi:hypothetical protein
MLDRLNDGQNRRERVKFVMKRGLIVRHDITH